MSDPATQNVQYNPISQRLRIGDCFVGLSGCINIHTPSIGLIKFTYPNGMNLDVNLCKDFNTSQTAECAAQSAAIYESMTRQIMSTYVPRHQN